MNKPALILWIFIFYSAPAILATIGIIAVAHGEGYQIDEKAANDTLDKVKTKGIALIQLIASLINTAVSGSVDTFYPGEVNPVLVIILSIIFTVVAVFSIAMAIGNKISKIALFVILAVVVIFMAVPMFQVQVPA